MAVPGLTPMFPVMSVAPVLVNAVAESAPYVFASPRTTGKTRFSRRTGSADGSESARLRRARRATDDAVNFMMIEAGVCFGDESVYEHQR